MHKNLIFSFFLDKLIFLFYSCISQECTIEEASRRRAKCVAQVLGPPRARREEGFGNIDDDERARAELVLYTSLNAISICMKHPLGGERERET